MIREKYSMFDPSKDAMCEITREQADKLIDSAKEVERQIAEDDMSIDQEIAKLKALKEKGEKNGDK